MKKRYFIGVCMMISLIIQFGAFMTAYADENLTMDRTPLGVSPLWKMLIPIKLPKHSVPVNLLRHNIILTDY